VVEGREPGECGVIQIDIEPQRYVHRRILYKQSYTYATHYTDTSSSTETHESNSTES
jgi:hypothetical protein